MVCSYIKEKGVQWGEYFGASQYQKNIEAIQARGYSKGDEKDLGDDNVKNIGS